MDAELASKAVTYLLGLGDWRPKLRLAAVIGAPSMKNEFFSDFKRKLTQLPHPTGLFPFAWIPEQPASLRDTALAADTLACSTDSDSIDSIKAASQGLLSQQALDGSWSESQDLLDRLRRREIHPAWSRDVDKAEITATILASLKNSLPHSGNHDNGLKGREWLQHYLKEQDFETKRSGEEYSLNPWTLDRVVSTLLDLGVEPTKPSMADAINILRRSIMRALRRTQRYPPWSLLAGTQTLLRLKEDHNLLDQVADALSSEQRRDGSWRINRSTIGEDTGAWTLHALSFLASAKPTIRRNCALAILEAVNLRTFVATTLTRNDETTRQIFQERFSEVGVKHDQTTELLLFACFLYSVLEQFYWVTSEFDPQSEYLNLLMQIGRLERVGLQPYMDTQTLRRALFRSAALRNQASQRKGEVALSISLFATFINTSKPESFRAFALSLRRFVLDHAPNLALGWKRDEELGRLLRLEVQERKDPLSLIASLRGALMCLPGVGEKVSALFLYYVGHIFRIWSDVPKDLLSIPVDWNVVKPYSMLRMTAIPLEQLRQRPQVANGSIQQTAAEMFERDSSQLYGLWVVGQEWCARPWMCRDKAGRYCWLYEQCPYPRSKK